MGVPGPEVGAVGGRPAPGRLTGWGALGEFRRGQPERHTNQCYCKPSPTTYATHYRQCTGWNVGGRRGAGATRGSLVWVGRVGGFPERPTRTAYQSVLLQAQPKNLCMDAVPREPVSHWRGGDWPGRGGSSGRSPKMCAAKSKSLLLWASRGLPDRLEPKRIPISAIASLPDRLKRTVN